MSNVAFQRDVGAYITARSAIVPVVIDAGTTTEDGVEINGLAISRTTDFSVKDVPLSAKVVVNYSFTGAAGNTATLVSNVQHSSVSSAGWADYDDKDGSTSNSASIGSTGSTASQQIEGVLQYDVDLGRAKKFIRVQVTPTLSGTSTGTDDLDVSGVMVFGGFYNRPPA